MSVNKGLVRRDHTRQSRAFTLVELLAVIAIIGILASLILMALWSVAEEARRKRTQAIIRRIDSYVRDRWDNYPNRRIGLQHPPGTPYLSEAVYEVRFPGTQNDRYLAYGRAYAYARLQAIRELMRMELPDRKADLLTPREIQAAGGTAPAPIIVYGADDPRTNLAHPLQMDPNNNNYLPTYLDSVPALWYQYRAIAMQLLGANPTSNGPNWHASWTPQFESAECLYLILSTISDDERSALEWFDESEIGDTDNDGIPEILDGWGVPIGFIRWPAGFVKQYTPPPQHALISSLPYSEIMAGDRAWDQDGTTVEVQPRSSANLPISTILGRDWQRTGGSDDPFDPLKVDVRWYDAPGSTLGSAAPFNGTGTYHAWNNDPFELVPLVVSAGPDKQFDLVSDSELPLWYETRLPTLGAQSDGAPVPNDPYAFSRGSPPRQAGAVKFRGSPAQHFAGDNIHNHQTGVTSP